MYGERYAWCGNFQESRCAVRLPGGDYIHIADDGTPAYVERYRYAGDFKDGYAVVQREDGKHTHIDRSGNPLHGRWFQDLDVFHKRYARACDSNGWHHVDMTGEPLYGERFRNVEPFYNGQARVEAFDGSLSVIDESGQTLLELRGPSRNRISKSYRRIWSVSGGHRRSMLRWSWVSSSLCPHRRRRSSDRPSCIDRLGRD